MMPYKMLKSWNKKKFGERKNKQHAKMVKAHKNNWVLNFMIEQIQICDKKTRRQNDLPSKQKKLEIANKIH